MKISPKDTITVKHLKKALETLPEEAPVRATFVGCKSPLRPREVLYVWNFGNSTELHIDDERCPWGGGGEREPLFR